MDGLPRSPPGPLKGGAGLIKGTGYVVDCLEAALRAFYKNDDFHTGALMAVNLSEDADVIPDQSSGTLRGRCGLRSNRRCMLPGGRIP